MVTVFWMRAYYGPDGRRGTKRRPNMGRVGERPGDLAVETVHGCLGSLEKAVKTVRGRRDIAIVETDTRLVGRWPRLDAVER